MFQLLNKDIQIYLESFIPDQTFREVFHDACDAFDNAAILYRNKETNVISISVYHIYKKNIYLQNIKKDVLFKHIYINTVQSKELKVCNRIRLEITKNQTQLRAVDITSNRIGNEGAYRISHPTTCTFQASSFMHSLITPIHGNTFVPQVPWYRGTREARE